MKVPAFLYQPWRRWFGRHEIRDPRRTAEENPYTFYLPSENEVLALAPGDSAKLIIASIPASYEWDAERMWVKIDKAEGAWLEGTLDNEPLDMPQLRPGSRIRFRRDDVISMIWAEDRAVKPPPAPEHREYWDRCYVDLCVTDDKVPVHYLYREDPDPTPEGDKYPDSGWRIRGDYRHESDEEFEARDFEYVALGRALNADDSWLHLIDAPVGSAFIRNWETGLFEACEPLA